MFIFLYGPDDYRRVQKKREIIAEFRKKHSDLGLGFFDLTADGAVDRLIEFARAQSIFESAKLAVLLNAFELDAEGLAKILKPFAADRTTSILIVEREKPVKALAFLAEKPSLSQKFEALEGPEWGAFIRAEAKRAGVALTPAAVQFLAIVHQGNSWALVTELEKLAALRADSPAPIDKKDLEAFDLEAAPNYWALLNGMKSFDVRTRLFALEKLFALSDPAPKIFNIIAAQAGPKIPLMAGYDLAVKSGKIDYEEALLDLVVS